MYRGCEILRYDERIKRPIMNTWRFIYVINATNHLRPGIRQVNVMFSYERRNYDNQNVRESYLSLSLGGLLLPGGNLTLATSTGNLEPALVINL